MHLLSWNVNGIRAAQRKGLLEWFAEANPDVFCFQETKAHQEQLDDELVNVPGYQSFFASSELRKGYSGVATYTKLTPDSVAYGMGIQRFDQEGRMVETTFGDTVLLNIYFPNGGQGPDRLQFKLDYYEAFLRYIEKLRKQGKHIIFCGDVNTAHRPIDLARPRENEKNTGFLPVERAWIDKVVNHGYIDTFRLLHPQAKDAYSWWDMKTRARERNVGWRIDYFFVSQDLKKHVKKATIHPDVLGSDHCPIGLEIET